MKSKKVYSFCRRRTSLRLAQLTVYSIMLLIFNYLLCTLCYAQTVSSAELINNAKKYDGNIVAYTGEVIGDVMNRGKYSWVNVNDGANALGIWISNDLVKNIEHTGNYKTSGDVVAIEGVFYRRCIEHGGDLDLHALSLRKIDNGGVILEKINTVKKTLVIILAGGLCLVLILNRLRRK